VIVSAGTLTILGNGEIQSLTFGSGNGGSVSVNVTGQLTIDAASANTNFLTGISAQANAGSIGNAGDISVTAGAVSIANGGAISSGALGPLNGLPASTGDAGQVTVTAGTLSIASNGAIVSNTFGSGKGGSVFVTVDGQLTITGSSGSGLTGIATDAEAGKTGDAGKVVVNAGALTILSNGEISSSTFGFGNSGSVAVDVSGELMIDATSANTRFLTGIAAEANGGSSGNAGTVQVSRFTCDQQWRRRLHLERWASARAGTSPSTSIAT
jgi:large exoprotein involved in heme utilization and adhesion